MGSVPLPAEHLPAPAAAGPDAGGALVVRRAGGALHGDRSGAGPPVLLLHGLTATRRYVLHGSGALERAGHDVIAYDARGHGESDPAPEAEGYDYGALVADALAALNAAGVERAALAGHSMGAATAAALALRHPERVAALVLVTPAHRGRPSADLERWDRLADGLERGGPEGFLAAYGSVVPARWAGAERTMILQRLARHRHPGAVAAALRQNPRSAAFDGLEALEAVRAPTLVVGSRDEIDPGHPLEVAEAYAARIPGARLLVEAEGEAPLAWRGGRLATAIAAFLAEAGWA
jgi:pimeloyl-ACP methyl ester carboxylesterase